MCHAGLGGGLNYDRNATAESIEFGFGPLVVRRYHEGEQLIWEYLNRRVTHSAVNLKTAMVSTASSIEGKPPTMSG
jgi:hypothetical protein